MHVRMCCCAKLARPGNLLTESVTLRKCMVPIKSYMK